MSLASYFFIFCAAATIIEKKLQTCKSVNHIRLSRDNKLFKLEVLYNEKSNQCSTICFAALQKIQYYSGDMFITISNILPF